MGVPLAILGLEICRLVYKFSLTYVNVHQELTLSSVFILIWIKMHCAIDHYKLRYRRRRTCCCFLFLLTKEMIRIKRSPKQFLVKFNRSSFLSLVLRKETDVMLFCFCFFQALHLKNHKLLQIFQVKIVGVVYCNSIHGGCVAYSKKAYVRFILTLLQLNPSVKYFLYWDGHSLSQSFFIENFVYKRLFLSEKIVDQIL